MHKAFLPSMFACIRSLFATLLLVFVTATTGLGQSVTPPQQAKPVQEERGIYDTIKVSVCYEADGTAVPCGWLDPVAVFAKMSPYWRNYHREWTRLRNAVYVTYPYAVAASKIMNEINAKLVNVTDKKERRRIIKMHEKDLRREFTSKLTKLSVYQGKVLMKLINRQTGNNCYEIVDEYKGHFNAVLYQSVAYVFGSSLKQSYHAQAEDRAMELIVLDVERMYGVRK